VSGKIYNAGMGFYNRAAVMTSPGTVIGDGKSVPAVEDVAAQWEKILSLKGAREYEQLNDLVLGDMLAALQPKPAATDDSPAGGAAAGVAEVFAGMPNSFQADAARGVDVVFQFTIGGEGGGDWVVAVKDGACRVEPGIHAKPNTMVRMDGADFLAMMAGKLSAMQAYTSGKIKIGGDLMKSQLIEKLFKF
jgi:putative sterol carrier protein